MERLEARLRAAIALGAALFGLGVLRWGGEGPVAPLPRPARLEGAAGLLWGVPLDLHRADTEALQVLPGIGPARARAIVAARCRRPFHSLADLRRIRGIGPRTVARLAGQAEVRDPRPRGCGSISEEGV